jgi:uncharacterized Tic20 family protein
MRIIAAGDLRRRGLQMEMELSSEERNWAMASHLCGLLWLAGGPGLIFFPFGGLVLVIIAAVQVSDGKSYRYPICLRLVK